MQGETNESVGEFFSEQKLHEARRKALDLLAVLEKHAKPGLSEKEMKLLLQEEQKRGGSEKSWHPPQIRFGTNSILSFNKPGEENKTLGTDDIFFLDIGPIYDGHEADVGRTYVLGNNAQHLKCKQDVQTIWQEVSDHWRHTGATGQQLYSYAKERAQFYGWILTLEKANGHRISDFPHAAKIRGGVDGLDYRPAPNRWILEIQINSEDRKFGAFYEDVLY